MDESIKFKDAYNRLDRYLKTICNIKGHINLISYYEMILPEKKRSEMKTIREFKNSIESHGVSINGKMPIPPLEFTNWVLKELEFCKKNSDQVANKIKKLLSEKRKNNEDKKNLDKSSTKKIFVKKDSKAITNEVKIKAQFVEFLVQSEVSNGYLKIKYVATKFSKSIHRTMEIVLSFIINGKIIYKSEKMLPYLMEDKMKVAKLFSTKIYNGMIFNNEIICYIDIKHLNAHEKKDHTIPFVIKVR